MQLFLNRAVKDKRSLEDFLFVALAAILFNGAEPSQPSWNFDQQNFTTHFNIH